MHTALASSLHSHPHCTRIQTALHSHPHCTVLASALRISAPAPPPQPPFHASPCYTRHLPRAGLEFVVVDDERMPSTSDGDYSYVMKPAGLSKTDPNPNLAQRNRSESEPGTAKPIRIRTWPGETDPNPNLVRRNRSESEPDKDETDPNPNSGKAFRARGLFEESR